MTILQKELWIDALRAFACFCVCVMHAPIPGGSRGLVFIPLYNYFATGGFVLFFMISGALVLWRAQPCFPFLKHRLLRIVPPLVIWSIVSLSVDYFDGTIADARTWVGKMAMIPFACQVGIYWYLYCVLGIYLITPPLWKWLNSLEIRELRLYLCLWLVAISVPYLRLVHPCFGAMIGVTGPLYYAFGYFGYALLGYYLRKYGTIRHVGVRHIVSAVVIAVLPVVLYQIPAIPHDMIHGNLSINVVLLAAVYFVLFKRFSISPRWSGIIQGFARYSFGIYLVHLLVMRKVLWPLLASFDIHYALQIPLIAIATVIISYVIVRLLARLPYSRYIVGV